jgi:peptidoglycan/xylan/chitin deacetylase (PgdA/CDA1 family)
MPSSVRARVRDATPAPIRSAARRARKAGERRLSGSITSVDTGEPVVAFTYDDGPHPERSPAIASALEARGAHATFFVLAAAAEDHPDLVRRLLHAGHEIGLHGGDHRNLRHCDWHETEAVVRGGKRRVEAITGQPVRLFRPPFGEQTRRSHALARALGMDVVVWSTNTRDCYEGTVDGYVANARRKLRPGAIVLFHDGLSGPDPRVVRADQEPPASFDRVALADAMLDETASHGLRVVPVGELLRLGTPRREVWLGS